MSKSTKQARSDPNSLTLPRKSEKQGVISEAIVRRSTEAYYYGTK